ncbi:MAG: hypothetical protein NC038_04955 [Paludibacter sp.]|nr:hypothetical protein [Bacteroidales bacterium]MCM1068343.1 hypothetical protein [Prevotella sp.]MCM1354029.1 hypothetical protein [Bacteroides sp.]MCM1442129.1 hypothetical protein [Muribaculum sp.]MCM1481978.1 hypothetical protein [Paludibacter sp.]
MQTVVLPLSKSIANRLLIRIALRGGDWGIVPTNDACDDIRLLYNLLTKDTHDYHTEGKLQGERFVDNCGTAMRFLTAYYAALPHTDILLRGNERMCKRPIGGLVDALRCIGADITYLEEEGYPPLHIKGKRLSGGKVILNQPESTQFISALMLISDQTGQGIDIETDCRSPYIDMTRQLINDAHYIRLEHDWSAAAFWYEYVALTPEADIFFPGLSLVSVQGDRCVADIFAALGVITTEHNGGIHISHNIHFTQPTSLQCDFTRCPDLYPAVYMACKCLGITMNFIGTERLLWKESDRLHAFDQLDTLPAGQPCCTYADHRIAMSLLVAGYTVDNTACIAKSYPTFISAWEQCKQHL